MWPFCFVLHLNLRSQGSQEAQRKDKAEFYAFQSSRSALPGRTFLRTSSRKRRLSCPGLIQARPPRTESILNCLMTGCVLQGCSYWSVLRACAFFPALPPSPSCIFTGWKPPEELRAHHRNERALPCSTATRERLQPVPLHTNP